MNKLYVDSFVEKKIKRGIQLLDGKDFHQLDLDNQLVALYNHSRQFLGTAYLSRQNKGIGWFLGNGKVDLIESYFESLFSKAKQKRQHFENSDLTTVYRLFNQDGDNFGGVTIDRYADFVVFSWYNTFVYQYRDIIVKAFQKVYPAVKGGYEKIRFKGLDYESAHIYGQEAPETFTILENGVKYSVFMNDGLMTGIFLDQHEVRDALINELGLGKRVLNMFSYTAAFSVAAAMGGAIETTSVDLAKRSRELSQAHFEANGLNVTNHHFVVMDVFEYFKYAKRKNLTFDLIVIDPPSFARNKKQTFSVAKDYHRLISQALEVLSDDGTIIASTNAANLTVAQFKKQLEKGFASVKHEYIRLQQLPSDFTVNKADMSSNYLKVFTIKVEK
ncbi:putative SAM-dependent methyl transferase [Streptococcus infantarius subsp. infantarius]|uniref:class I SAM-dependent rRNA methyltransferase n=1 Tax=Streptococcus infantarius TaxID=102684 RepID=UPI001BDA2668|nr:class I SAM-dependent rRNA methyltransferase [Streptococcus infantarius]MBT0896842.1 class I SAM-dependent rRNA methyltransferase [Streptococcus infantarius subsp. infantarius]MBT0900576.1 class I SAM-dependent rRNA methyltransferase [Streptococcus infantarius subsp. infantarius]MBT1034290.1 class I SAM-dependent rRNA methyltransferase [Streptococcus infantarius subsp. infantarius]MCO4468558.1 putative SAM-dependent methyl transferase [Streptococcus infantarius subsp. infantarius]MCO4596959